MDNANEHAARLALRLLDRLAPVTDDEKAWQALPDELVVYRARRASTFRADSRGRSAAKSRKFALGIMLSL